MNRDLMGRNEYARHRGCSRNAVKKAEESGRIAPAVVRDSGRFVGIKWRLADELWEANTDPDLAIRSIASQPASATGSRPLQDAVQTSGQAITPGVLTRAIALAYKDFVEEACASGFADAHPAEPADVVDLGSILLQKIADRVEAAIGLAHGTAIRAFVDSLEEFRAHTITEAITQARDQLRKFAS